MTTDTETASSAAAILERLGAGGGSPPVLAFGELRPWLSAASVGGFELPPEVVEIAERALHLVAQQAENPEPAPYDPGDIARIITDGGSARDIYDATRTNEYERGRWKGISELLQRSEKALEADARDVFAAVRSQLISGVLREAVERAIAEARKPAEKLRGFDPEFVSTIGSSGTGADIKSWQESRAQQAKLETYHAAWKASWSEECASRGFPGQEYNPRRAGGYYAWEDPEAIPDEQLRFGHDRDVLRIALAASPYRLLAPSELEALLTSLDAKLKEQYKPGQQPWNARSRVQLGVVT